MDNSRSTYDTPVAKNGYAQLIQKADSNIDNKRDASAQDRDRISQLTQAINAFQKYRTQKYRNKSNFLEILNII